MANEIYKNENGKLVVNKDEEISLLQLQKNKERLERRKEQLYNQLSSIEEEIERINYMLNKAIELNIVEEENISDNSDNIYTQNNTNPEI